LRGGGHDRRFSLQTAALTFVWLVVAGIAAGVGLTLVVTWAQRWLVRHFGEPPALRSWSTC
jgi:CPA1 family monovalent cation:H+ antiporter